MKNSPAQTYPEVLPPEVGAAVLAHYFYSYQAEVVMPRAGSDEDLQDVLATVANHTGKEHEAIRQRYGNQVLELMSELNEFFMKLEAL